MKNPILLLSPLRATDTHHHFYPPFIQKGGKISYTTLIIFLSLQFFTKNSIVVDKIADEKHGEEWKILILWFSNDSWREN
jgi:hypothetical protein